MAGEAVLAHQSGVDRHAGDALAEPALDEGAVGSEGRLGRGRQARGRLGSSQPWACVRKRAALARPIKPERAISRSESP